MSASAPLAVLPPAALVSFNALRALDYLQVVNACLYIYDVLLTTKDEVELVWKSKWKLFTFIYFANRYLPFVGIISGLYQQFVPDPTPFPKICEVIYKLHGWQVFAGLMIADSILVVRTFAIWGTNRKSGYPLLGFYLVNLGVETYFISKFMDSLAFAPSPSPSAFPGCFASKADTSSAWITYLILLVFETIIFLITLLKLLLDSNGAQKSPILRTLYRDGISFYALICGISLINIVVLRINAGGFGFILADTHRVLHSILTTRLVLNIRKVANPDSSTARSTTISI